MKTYKIKATVITPVSIGNGQQLSPYKDYFIKNGLIHYIDTNKLGQLLAKDDELMDEYVEGVANMEGNRSRFDIYNFINLRLKKEPVDIVKAKAPFIGERNIRKLPVQEICKTPKGDGYIPGSTIKGSIKTALLFNSLNNEDNELISQLLKNPNNTEDIEKKLQEFILSTSDSDTISPIDIICIYDQRLHVKKGTFIIPTYREAIKENSVFNFTIQSNESWENLSEAINNYAIAGLKTEKDIMIDADEDEKIDLEIYNSLYDFYDKMGETAQNNRDKTLLRIGSGKGFYMNSIAEIIFHKDNTDDKSKFKKYLKAIGYGKAYNPSVKKMVDYNLDPYLFPITRNILSKTIQPLGWIKLDKTD